MLYSVPFNNFNGKDYRIKIGTLEMAKFQEKDIDVDNASIKDNFEIMCIALKELDETTNKLKHVNMKVEEFMQLWDESDYNIDDLIDTVEDAIKKGLYKGREQKKNGIDEDEDDIQVDITGNWFTDLYVICVNTLKCSADEFYSMSISEIEDRLYYKRLQDRLKALDNAYYIGCFVMNEKASDTYKNIKGEILGINSLDRIKTDVERYKMISERLGIKYPKRGVK